ncbi:MAG: hypothetical protein B6I24_02670 [Bacteroidetes bacterium 4572_128]|nr:MAG: hypothetical protein B6I24_02670 [Bacteroidetes bacterium 4572_128]
MLFYISPNLVSKLKENPSDNLIIEAIDNLAFSRRQAYHLLLAELNDLKFLSRCESLQKKTKAIFNILYQTYSEIGSYKNEFKYYVEIVYKQKTLQIKKENEKEIIELSIDYIQKFDLLKKSEILLENISEIKFYIFMSKFFKKENRLYINIPSMYDVRNGGGHTMGDVYSHLQNKKKSFCLCFADKDIKYPNSKEGDTLEKVKNIDDKKIPLCKLIAIDVREIENLIPEKLLEKTCENDTNWKKGYEFFIKMKNENLEEEIKYMDFKKGFSLNKFVELKNKDYINFVKKIMTKTNLSNEKDFDKYRNFIDIIKKGKRISFSKFQNLKNEYIEKNNVENKILDFFNKEQIISGMGNDLLKRLIYKHIDNDTTISKNDLLKFQLKEWNKIGEYITFWTCGDNNHNANFS